MTFKRGQIFVNKDTFLNMYLQESEDQPYSPEVCHDVMQLISFYSNSGRGKIVGRVYLCNHSEPFDAKLIRILFDV